MSGGINRRREKKRIRRALVRHELARRSFVDFLALANGPDWIPTRFSTFLAENVQNFLETETGNAYDILILETPPQHGKSWTITESLPAWWMMKHPGTRVILASYSEESAERFSRRNREKAALWGPILFGTELGDMNRATAFNLKGQRGQLLSRGMMSSITGNAADLMIIDDPIKNREEADSQVYRDKLWAEWLNSLKSRLQAGSKLILILTPWHEDDIAARILQTEENVTLLRLPVAAEPTEDQPDPLGRAPGEPLCPELGKGKTWLEQFRRAYLNDPRGGQRAWLSLYLCRPRAETGNIIQRQWWRFCEAPPAQFARQCISVDCAFKDGQQNDFTAITVWGKRDEDYFLLDCRNEHLDFIGTLKALRETRKKYPEARAVLVEDKANGSAVISVLRKEMFCIPVQPKGDKTERVHAVAPAIESGHVFLPRYAPWLEEYLDQWTAFPAGKHDDMVDSSTQAMRYLLNVSGNWQPPDAKERRRIADEETTRELLTGADAYNIYGGW